MIQFQYMAKCFEGLRSLHTDNCEAQRKDKGKEGRSHKG